MGTKQGRTRLSGQARKSPDVAQVSMVLSALVLTADDALAKFRARRAADRKLDLAHLERVRDILDFVGEAIVWGNGRQAEWRKIEQAWRLLFDVSAVRSSSAPAALVIPPSAPEVTERTAAATVGDFVSVSHEEPPGPPSEPAPSADVLAAAEPSGAFGSPPSPPAPDRVGPSSPPSAPPAPVSTPPPAPEAASTPPAKSADPLASLPAHARATLAALEQAEASGAKLGDNLTMPIGDGARAAKALPFVQGAYTPSTAAPAPRARRGATVATPVVRPQSEPALPFARKAEPSPHAASAAEGALPRHLSTIGVEQFATYCAECAASPSAVEQIDRRYGIADATERAAFERHWHGRLAQEPALLAAWREHLRRAEKQAKKR